MLETNPTLNTLKDSLSVVFKDIKQIILHSEKEELTHPLLKKFKPPYYSVMGINNTKIEWISYQEYEYELEEFFRRYYGLKQIKSGDSTFKKLKNDLKNQIKYVELFFDEKNSYTIVIK